MVCWLVGCLVVWLRAEEQKRCIRNFRVLHNNSCIWLSHKTRTNIADADSLFDTPCTLHHTVAAAFIQPTVHKQASSLQQRLAKLPAQLPDTAHSCSRHGVVAARLSSERPGSATAISKTFIVRGWCVALNRTEHTDSCLQSVAVSQYRSLVPTTLCRNLQIHYRIHNSPPQVVPVLVMKT